VYDVHQNIIAAMCNHYHCLYYTAIKPLRRDRIINVSKVSRLHTVSGGRTMTWPKGRRRRRRWRGNDYLRACIYGKTGLNGGEGGYRSIVGGRPAKPISGAHTHTSARTLESSHGRRSRAVESHRPPVRPTAGELYRRRLEIRGRPDLGR